MEVSLLNQASEIPLVHRALDQMAACHGLPDRLVARLHLAIEEHLTNVISYGYRSGQAGTIAVRFGLQPSALRVEVEDDARPFNPLAVPEVDTSLPMEQKPIGGLGVHMMRRNVDEMEYRSADGRNVLVMIQRLQ